MKSITQIFICLMLFLNSCQENENKSKHVFYLHGRIVELQGKNAISEKYGKYEYDNIISALNEKGTKIHHEVRTDQTDFQDFCRKTSDQIDKLIESGVNPENITIIGASKGGIMAMNISNMNINPINYILLASNNEQIEQKNQWNLHGRILGIYEKTDSIANKNYKHWIDSSTNAVEFKQLELNTGLGHGFLYRPMNEWITPTKNWMQNKN